MTNAYLAVISLDSALKKDDNYYPQVLLKECKYTEKIVIRHIHDNLSDFFILLLSLMKNKLQLVRRSCFKKYGKLLLQKGMYTKKYVVFLKLCLKFIKQYYVYNISKHKKVCNKLYLNFLLDKVYL